MALRSDSFAKSQAKNPHVYSRVFRERFFLYQPQFAFVSARQNEIFPSFRREAHERAAQSARSARYHRILLSHKRTSFRRFLSIEYHTREKIASDFPSLSLFPKNFLFYG